MIFNRKATPRWFSAVAGLLAAVGLSVLLSSCGGGTSQYDPFTPNRLLVFGDDDSYLAPDGRKYGLNGFDAAGNFDCRQQANWVQQLASLYGFVFAECNPTSDFELRARMLAQVNSKVADVTAQVEAQVAAGGFRDKDLATVLVGKHDILELYNLTSQIGEVAAIAEAKARGVQLGRLVNRLVALGVKVIVSDLPDMGVTAFAASQNTLNGSTRPAELLTRLTTAFNEQVGVTVLLDGRYVGLVQAQLRFQAIARSPPSFGFTNITGALCSVPVPECTTSTVVTGGDINSWLWADEIHMSPGGHTQLAILAIDRARRNPF